MKLILLTLTAAFFVQLGYFIWKLAAPELPRIGEAKIFFVLKSFFTSWKWLLGMLLRLFGLFLFIKATALGALSVVQPLMSAGDVFIVFLAVIFLGERVGRWEFGGLFLVLLGGVTISFEAKTVMPVAIDWLQAGVFLVLSLTSLVGLLLLAKRKQKLEIILAVAVGVCFAISMVLIKLMTTSLTLSGHPVNLQTCLSNPIIPFIILSNISALLILQMAFQNGRAAIVIPLQLAVVSGVAVLAGTLLFSEKISLYRLVSILLIVTGAFLLQYAGREETNPANLSKG